MRGEDFKVRGGGGVFHEMYFRCNKRFLRGLTQIIDLRHPDVDRDPSLQTLIVEPKSASAQPAPSGGWFR